MSLAELLVTVFILSVGILSSLMFFVTAMTSTELARDTTTATTHGEYIMEEMKTRSTLSNITATNWSTWIQAEGASTLPAESVSVTYTNSTADPLEIFVAVSWTKKNRTSSVNLTTKMTK